MCDGVPGIHHFGDVSDELAEGDAAGLLLAGDEVEDHDAHQDHENPEEQCFLALFHSVSRDAGPRSRVRLGPSPLPSL